MGKKHKNKYQEAAERAGQGDITRIEFKQGENIIRIIDPDFSEAWTFFVPDTDNETKKITDTPEKYKDNPAYKLYKETGDDDYRPSHRYFFNAVAGIKKKLRNKKTGEIKTKIVLDNEVKLLEVGPKIFKQIAAIQMDDEYPEIDEINLKIKRTGEGLKTDYNVLPAGKSSPLPDDLTEGYDLEEQAAPTPLGEVNKILGLDDEEGEEDETPKKKKTAPAKPKKAKKPAPVEEGDEEDEEETEEDLDEEVGDDVDLDEEMGDIDEEDDD